MFTRLQYFTRWSVLASCSLIFAVLLVACGGSGTGGTTSTPVPTPTSPPASPTAATGAMIAYPGNGFTIISADSVASTALKAAQVLLKNPQTVSVSSTSTVGGDSWSQIAASGTQRLNNQDTDVQVVVLADVHPANTPLSKSFTILYQAPVSTFSQDNTAYFQPMLQSFKFG